jgi:hypothetical protein
LPRPCCDSLLRSCSEYAGHHFSRRVGQEHCWRIFSPDFPIHISLPLAIHVSSHTRQYAVCTASGRPQDPPHPDNPSSLHSPCYTEVSGFSVQVSDSSPSLTPDTRHLTPLVWTFICTPSETPLPLPHPDAPPRAFRPWSCGPGSPATSGA